MFLGVLFELKNVFQVLTDNCFVVRYGSMCIESRLHCFLSGSFMMFFQSFAQRLHNRKSPRKKLFCIEYQQFRYLEILVDGL